jgi:mRNA interferase HigB
MRVIAKKMLREFWEEHSDAEGQLEAWYHEVKREQWNNPGEMKAKYGSADIVGDCTVFNIGGNKYRLIVKIRYAFGVVYTIRVATHKEYDKLDVKGL